MSRLSEIEERLMQYGDAIYYDGESSYSLKQDAATLLRLVRSAKELLPEWQLDVEEGIEICPTCMFGKREGHQPGCSRAAWLTAVDEETTER